MFTIGLYMVKKKIVSIILSAACILCMCGCTQSQNTSVQFSSIDFPDVQTQVFAHQVETRNISELFSEYTTVAAPTDFYFYGQKMIGSRLYGRTARLQQIHYGDFGYLDLETGENGILVETPFGKYSNIPVMETLGDYVICRSTGYEPYELEFFAYNTTTDEKVIIDHVYEAPYSAFCSDGKDVMYNVPNYTNGIDNTIYRWAPGDSHPEKIVAHGYWVFKVGDTWYCCTHPEDDFEDISLARINGNELETIALNNIDGVLWNACAMDDTHILITSMSPVSATYTRVYVYDMTSGQTSYLFDIAYCAESFTVYDHYICWYGYPTDVQEGIRVNILYDYRNKIRYVSDFRTIVVSDKGIAFDTLADEYAEMEDMEKVRHAQWHYAEWGDVISDAS